LRLYPKNTTISCGAALLRSRFAGRDSPQFPAVSNEGPDKSEEFSGNPRSNQSQLRLRPQPRYFAIESQ
jgi:hypothetical protein